MNIGYSLNLFDFEGDKFDTCILIHINDEALLRFETMTALQEFQAGLDHEIKSGSKGLSGAPIEIKTGTLSRLKFEDIDELIGFKARLDYVIEEILEQDEYDKEVREFSTD